MWKRALHFHYMYCAAQHHQITSVSKINLLIKISPNQKFIIFVNVSNLLLALNGYYNPYWNILTCELKLLWSIMEYYCLVIPFWTKPASCHECMPKAGSRAEASLHLLLSLQNALQMYYVHLSEGEEKQSVKSYCVSSKIPSGSFTSASQHWI